MACMKRDLAECARESYPLSPRRSTQLCQKIYHIPLRWRILCADGAEVTFEDLFRKQLWQLIRMGVVRNRAYAQTGRSHDSVVDHVPSWTTNESRLEVPPGCPRYHIKLYHPGRFILQINLNTTISQATKSDAFSS